MRRVLLDCDPGIDDALAILLALASPEITLEAITTVAGNSTIENETRNALALLTLCGRTDIPVAAGCARPLIQPLQQAADTHGADGLGYAVLPEPMARAHPAHAVDLIIETALRAPGEITLVAVGPLTNVALALRKEPRLAGALRDCIIMGGAIEHTGNMPMGAEFNAWCDPHAAHIVFHSGLPITLVPLDVTYQCILTQAHLATLPDTPVTRFIRDATRFYIEFHKAEQGIDGCAINDALALALTLAPDLVRTKPLFVDIDLHGGPGHAKTFGDTWNLTRRAPNMNVALQVDVPRFFALFLERMAQL